MMMVKRNDKEAEIIATPKKKKRSKLLIAILAVFLVIGAAGAVYLFKIRPGSAEPLEKKTELIMGEPLDFTVNLADTGRTRYLRTTVVLAYDNKRLTKELAKKEPEIRDLIITILRGKLAEEISTTEGTDEVRQQIRDELAGRLLLEGVTEVYFTQFLMQ
jgi:flagellar basal body-associated protein FliL